MSRLARSGVEAGVVAGGYEAWSQDETLPREGDAVDEALAEAPLWCEPWSDWADGPAEMQPVLERIAPDEGGAAEDDGFDEMDGALGGAEGDALEYADKNEYTHLYTLVVKPDGTYQVLFDLEEKAAGARKGDVEPAGEVARGARARGRGKLSMGG